MSTPVYTKLTAFSLLVVYFTLLSFTGSLYVEKFFSFYPVGAKILTYCVIVFTQCLYLMFITYSELKRNWNTQGLSYFFCISLPIQWHIALEVSPQIKEDYATTFLLITLAATIVSFGLTLFNVMAENYPLKENRI